MFLAIVAAIFLLAPSVNQYLTDLSDTRRDTDMQVEQTLSWVQYWEKCQKYTTASMHVDCHHFSGLSVNWEGTVEDISVQIHNPITKVLDNFPDLIKEKLACWYGEKYNDDCSSILESDKRELCDILKKVRPRNRKCHLENWNKYEFEILVKLKLGHWTTYESVVALSLEDSLRNFTLKLHPNDNIWFSGRLLNSESGGSKKLKILVEEVGCIACYDRQLTNMKKQSNKYSIDQIFRLLYNGLKYVLNFLFNPLVIFR